MRIIDRGTVMAAAPGGPRAYGVSPHVVSLADGTLLVSYIVGSGKDTEDQMLELVRSTDGGRTWSAPERPFSPVLGGVRGCFRVAPVTRLEGDRLILATLWIDREAYPGQPLFHPETEGCLPMAIAVADSTDSGRTWSPLRVVPMTPDVGPPSLTNAILRLADGRLALSIESNKAYLDTSPWFQRVYYCWSSDQGRTWTAPTVICEDPTGRIANWDQRTGVAPDGRLASFTWTYDFVDHAYRNIQRRISADGGATWTLPDDLGFADQAAHPAMRSDGSVVLAWVDRFDRQAILARVASSIEAPFDPASEVVIHDGRAPVREALLGEGATTGDMLVDMGTWTWGLPYAETLPDGDVMVVHYAGVPGRVDIRWVRLRP